MFWKIGFLVIFTSFLFLNCQGKVDAEMMDTAAEEAALKELVVKQQQENLNQNFENFQTVWAHEPYTTLISGSNNVRIGWESIGTQFKKNFSTSTQLTAENRPIKTNEYHQIKIYDNTAWMVFKINIERKIDGNLFSWNRNAVRFFEKKDGQWKIVLHTQHELNYPEPLQTEVDLQNVGNRLLNSDQIDKAIEVFKLNVNLFPESTYAHGNLANAYLTMGNKQLAKKHCEKALELNPLNRSARALMEKI